MTLPDCSKNKSESFWQYGFVALSLIIALCLVWFGAEGLRGTDQYWYVADVERIVKGTPPITNTYFPGEILRNGEVSEQNYIHHNSPMLYIVASFASFMPVYCAWIFANLMCHLLVAFVIYSLAQKFTNFRIAVFVACFYLLSPLAIWQTINPLLEMYYSALVALVLFCFFNRELRWATIALWALLGLGVVSHPIFLVPALLCGLLWGWEGRSSDRKFVLPVCVIYFLACYYLLDQKDGWFPSSFQPSLKAIVASAVPGQSNMFWHYSEIIPEIDIQLIGSKAIEAVKRQVFYGKFAPLYVYTNIALTITVFLCIFRFKKWFGILLPLGVFGCQYVTMIVLQQNHPRFQQIVAPVCFVVIAIGVYELSARYKNRETNNAAVVAIACSLLVTIAGSFVIAQTGRSQSVNQKRDVEEVIARLAFIPENARLVGIDVKPHNPFSYIVRPRDMLFIDTEMLGGDKIGRAIELFEPDYLIAKQESELKSGNVVARFETDRFGGLVVYQFDR